MTTVKMPLSDYEQAMSDLCTETNRLRDKCAALEKAAADVCYAAARQLAGMGRGKEPSERLAEAFRVVENLIGHDPTADAASPVGRDA